MMKESTSTYSYLLGRTVADYWAWWTEQIVTSIPLWMRRLLFNAKNLILEVDGNIIEIYRAIGARKNNIGRVLLNELTTNQLTKLIRDSNAQNNVLSLAQQQVLEKNVSFPLATEENIREVLSFEMDRLTPFTSNQVYYDYYVLSRDKKKNTIDLKLIIVPRDKINPLIKQLKQIGFQAHVVTVTNATTGKQYPINLLPAEMRAKKLNTLKIVNYSLGVLLILLFLVSVFLPVYNKIKYIEYLEPEVSAYSKQADEINKLRKQLVIAKDEAEFLSERKQEKLLMLEILDELTQIVPDDTWISQYEVKKNEIHIHGQSLSSASLLPLIESSELFSNAQFRSPVTQNRQTNTERFHLSANIKQE